MTEIKRGEVVGVAFLLGLAITVGGCFARTTQDTVDVTVVKTERVSSGSGDTLTHKYLVFTTDETFENTDSIWYGKFNSSDLHGQLAPGRWRFHVYGYRLPVVSAYRNIVSATRID
jgi:hypothetical protein